MKRKLIKRWTSFLNHMADLSFINCFQKACMIDDPNCECDLNIGCSGYLMEIPFDDDGKDKVTDKGDLLPFQFYEETTSI